jgi:hypothetical protein
MESFFYRLHGEKSGFLYFDSFEKEFVMFLSENKNIYAYKVAEIAAFFYEEGGE